MALNCDNSPQYPCRQEILTKLLTLFIDHRKIKFSFTELTCDSVVAYWPAPEPAQTASVGSVTSPPQT